MARPLFPSTSCGLFVMWFLTIGGPASFVGFVLVGYQEQRFCSWLHLCLPVQARPTWMISFFSYGMFLLPFESSRFFLAVLERLLQVKEPTNRSGYAQVGIHLKMYIYNTIPKTICLSNIYIQTAVSLDDGEHSYKRVFCLRLNPYKVCDQF